MHVRGTLHSHVEPLALTTKAVEAPVVHDLYHHHGNDRHWATAHTTSTTKKKMMAIEAKGVETFGRLSRNVHVATSG